MLKEVQKLKKLMQNVSITEISGINFYSGTLYENKVTIIQSGIGKVNATIYATLLINILKVDTLINTEIAEALNNAVNIEDIVISDDTVQHDFDATGLGNF